MRNGALTATRTFTIALVMVSQTGIFAEESKVNRAPAVIHSNVSHEIRDVLFEARPELHEKMITATDLNIRMIYLNQMILNSRDGETYQKMVLKGSENQAEELRIANEFKSRTKDLGDLLRAGRRPQALLLAQRPNLPESKRAVLRRLSDDQQYEDYVSLWDLYITSPGWGAAGPVIAMDAAKRMADIEKKVGLDSSQSSDSLPVESNKAETTGVSAPVPAPAPETKESKAESL